MGVAHLKSLRCQNVQNYVSGLSGPASDARLEIVTNQLVQRILRRFLFQMLATLAAYYMVILDMSAADKCDASRDNGTTLLLSQWARQTSVQE